DVEGPRAPVRPVCGRVARSARQPEGILGEVAHRQVDLHGLPGLREVAGALDDLELAAGEPRQRLAVAGRGDLVAGSLDDEPRAVEAARQPPQGAPAGVDVAPPGREEGGAG